VLVVVAVTWSIGFVENGGDLEFESLFQSTELIDNDILIDKTTHSKL
jgi:hypothetical protein